MPIAKIAKKANFLFVQHFGKRDDKSQEDNA